MRGYPDYNFPAFGRAAAKIRDLGHTVWSPAERDLKDNKANPLKGNMQELKYYMKHDLVAVLDSDVVVLLDGWKESIGACLEQHVAEVCGIPSLTYKWFVRKYS
jgi:hypothetical protein